MRAFTYHRPTSLADALDQLGGSHQSSPMGGGTDLLVLIDEGLVDLREVVDLRYLPHSQDIRRTADGSVRIGASARIDAVAAHPVVVEDFPALAEACRSVGTPALRAMGTIGGNLCQRPRCWYYRRGIPCYKNGGTTCPAVDGENQYLAILGGGPCFIVHPSDPAVALTALEARIEISGPQGTRSVTIADFFVLPRQRLDHETVLANGEVVTAIVLPRVSAGGVQQYWKVMQRAAWDFALVSLAALKRQDGEVRLVLGGVAPRPWRVTTSVEEDVASGGLDDEGVETLAARALIDAAPLSMNGYKVRLAASVLREAMMKLGGAA